MAGVRRGERGVRVGGVLLSLWRAAAVFRVVTAVVCVYLVVRWRHLYAEPAAAFGAAAALLATTGALAALAWTGRAHRLGVVAGDVVVTATLTLITRIAQHPQQFHGDMPTLTSIWAAGPAIEAGLLLGGASGGIVAGLLQFAASAIVRDGYDGRTLGNGFLLVVVGGISGYLASITVRAEHERAMAAAERGRLRERELLTRSIHDGVLQILGLVHRQGRDDHGVWGALAREAGEQEAALRALITSTSHDAPTGARNITAELAALRSSRVTVSTPDAAVVLPAAGADALMAAVRAALHNIDQHAGPDARAWVLLESSDDQLMITVRDDGVGIPEGRLEIARSEGRLGVSASICGRIEDLGGSVRVASAIGQGTEVEMLVPLRARIGGDDQTLG